MLHFKALSIFLVGVAAGVLAVEWLPARDKNLELPVVSTSADIAPQNVRPSLASECGSLEQKLMAQISEEIQSLVKSSPLDASENKIEKDTDSRKSNVLLAQEFFGSPADDLLNDVMSDGVWNSSSAARLHQIIPILSSDLHFEFHRRLSSKINSGEITVSDNSLL